MRKFFPNPTRNFGEKRQMYSISPLVCHLPCLEKKYTFLGILFGQSGSPAPNKSKGEKKENSLRPCSKSGIIKWEEVNGAWLVNLPIFSFAASS